MEEVNLVKTNQMPVRLVFVALKDSGKKILLLEKTTIKTKSLSAIILKHQNTLTKLQEINTTRNALKIKFLRNL